MKSSYRRVLGTFIHPLTGTSYSLTPPGLVTVQKHQQTGSGIQTRAAGIGMTVAATGDLAGGKRPVNRAV